jgi:protein-S-isoprenylcysteine O-methyltransferase Ste14
VIDKLTGRGGGWVVAQFGLMALIVVAAFLPPEWPESAQRVLGVLGLVLFLGGAGFALVASRVMGRSLTPFPTPARAGRLVATGPFRVVRHPIYAGGLLVFGGIGLATSIPALAGAVLLTLLWVGKIRIEEKQLLTRYPGYDEYVQAVRFRIVPGVY